MLTANSPNDCSHSKLNYWPPFSLAFSGVLVSGFFGSLGANSPGFAFRDVPSSVLLCESVFPAHQEMD